MSMQDRIESLKAKHHELEERLDQESNRPMPNDAVLRELKHEKLQLKDEISRMQHAP